MTPTSCNFVRCLGVDPSLTGTGLCYLDVENGEIKKQEIVTVKTKPDMFDDPFQRLLYIKDFVESFVVAENTVVCVETVFVNCVRNVKTSLTLSELNGIICLTLYNLGCSLYRIPPSSLKFFCTGIGNASKEMVIETVQKKYGYTGNDDNQADAISLCHLAKSLHESDPKDYAKFLGKKFIPVKLKKDLKNG